MLGFYAPAIPVKYQMEQISNLRLVKCERVRHEMKDTCSSSFLTKSIYRQSLSHGHERF